MKTLWNPPTLLLGLALSGAIAATGAAAQGAPADEAMAGLKVVRDPVTGQLRTPELDEAGPAAAANARSAVSGAQQRRAQALQRFREATAVAGVKGAKGLRLDASHMNFSVVHRNADGSLTQDCVVGEQAAATALSTPVVSTATEDRHAH